VCARSGAVPSGLVKFFPTTTRHFRAGLSRCRRLAAELSVDLATPLIRKLYFSPTLLGPVLSAGFGALFHDEIQSASGHSSEIYWFVTVL
jgi:hypothetical protein